MFRCFVKGCVYIFLRIFFRVKIKGQENIEKGKPYILCANHSSNWDPVFLYAMTKRELYMMAKVELFKNAFIKWFGRKMNVFPVKRGKMDIESMKYSLKILKENNILAIFPEGTRNGLKKNGKAQNGTAYLAIRTGVQVVPVGISGKYKPFSKITLNYGKPLDFSEYKSNKPEKEVLEKVSQEIMNNIVELQNNVDDKK